MIAQGFRQQLRIDFDKTSVSLVSNCVVCLVLVVLRRAVMTMKHHDLKTAFLDSKVMKEIYETLPKGVDILEE